MPKTVHQWLILGGTDLLGIGASLVLGEFYGEHEVDKHKVDEHIGTRLQEWVGAIEVLLYSSSIVFGYPQFIAVWLGTKYIAAYRTWSEDPVGRTFYNRSLFGSALNVLIGHGHGWWSPPSHSVYSVVILRAQYRWNARPASLLRNRKCP